MSEEPWRILHDEDGESAIVVPEGTDPLDALFFLLEEEYGGTFSRTNPVLVEAASKLKVERWFSCSEKWKEAESIGEEDEAWWAPNGDGSESIFVVDPSQSVTALGELAEEAEPVSSSSPGQLEIGGEAE